MAEQQSPRLHRSAATKLDAARQQFLLAMEQLADEGIPNNPYSALVGDVFRGWKPAGSTPIQSSTFPRFRYSRNLADEEAKKHAQRRQVIEKWAGRFWLIGTDGMPADWIVTYAERVCQRQSGELRDGPTRLSKFDSVLGPRQLPPAFPVGLFVPMSDPNPRDGEPFPKFRKRVRHASTLHLRDLARQYGPETHLAKPRKVTPGSEKPITCNKLRDFRWLLLFQCCKWTLRRISEESEFQFGGCLTDRENAIWKALDRKAKLLGLALRRKPTA